MCIEIRLKATFIPILLLSLIISCNSRYMHYQTSIEERMKVFMPEILDNYASVIIIPGTGCPGCISNAEAYCFKHIDDSEKYYIFTNTLSVKLLSNRFKKQNIEIQTKNNVFVDTNNLFFVENTWECEYPFIFTISNGKIEKTNLLSNYVQD